MCATRQMLVLARKVQVTSGQHREWANNPARLLTTVCMLGLLISGCGAKQIADSPRTASASTISSTTIDVPFYSQQNYQCGPATMAMAMVHAGVEIAPDQLESALFTPGLKGSLQVEMLATPRRFGLLAYQLKPELDDLLQEVAAGHPVIVLQNLGLTIAPRWHYALITGLRPDQDTIILHSGEIANYSMPMSTFERTWQRGGSWAMVVLAAGDLPATADEKSYLTAVSGIEAHGFLRAALRSYQAAISRWPESLGAGMGSANCLYALGELEQAANTYLQLTKTHPDAACAFNNLAQTYLDQGRHSDALAMIRQAIAIDPHSPLYLLTLTEVEQAQTKKRYQHL
ncbi:PA2778 family cysteine peptidase [Mariprofundus erugo]|uniref:PA2778 family cysteine peptidase n=1 Tax=Mariprofundus erugo TaxID=2528639 RepID=UPI001EE83D44|nr:PA2778 family cysteine peptidase [Mariprofundus erugo]